MTLTPEQIARYEERAAKGETPVLPWADWPGSRCSEVSGTAGFLRIAWESGESDRPPFTARMGVPDTSDVFRRGKFSTLTAAKLFLDDALLAFARPLLERPVEGPWVCAEIGGRVLVGLKPDDTCISAQVAWDYALKFDRWSEAEAIARVRNEAWQRRQREKGNA